MAIDDEFAELIQLLQTWHGQRVGQLQKVIEHKTADIDIADIQIPANSDLAKGVRIGVSLALELLGELPFTLDEDGA